MKIGGAIDAGIPLGKARTGRASLDAACVFEGRLLRADPGI
jgi:hypothetical protein